MAYFPRSGAENALRITTPQLPFRPNEVGPIFDAEHSNDPIPEFDQEFYEQVYAGSSDTGEANQPATLDRFSGRYLFPSLSRNERLRLTLLWYHTTAIEQDANLLSEIDALVGGLQQAIGWEYAIAGILDESTYTRLATAHLPIARLPRREATCAHTINQKHGSVFMITNLAEDWRFRESPHVEIGGLRSYAGTQLRLLADHGEEISLGSLCVASDTPQPPLTHIQRDLLVRFAELISSTIASHTRQRRLKKREEMGNLLATLQTEVELDYERNAVELIRQIYPGAQVSLQLATDGKITVDGRSALSYSEVREGLWEDTQFIETTIRISNYAKLTSSQTVRAVIARCGRSDKYLVVASNDIQNVFDDFDAWYVSKSAAIIADTIQSRLLQQALEARETFLRGMTHQLRTPIHGILGSVEILSEELATRQITDSRDTDIDGNSSSTSPSACIATIRNSGQELMTTVNNILKHNTWTDVLKKSRSGPYDLRNLERRILPDILGLLPQEKLRNVSIEFRRELPDARCLLITDAQLLEDCVQALVLNAAQAVFGHSAGVVSVTLQSKSHLSWLTIDVVDNGCGIDIGDQARIFEPYEKVDSHRLGAGLGLTLACKIAPTLGGSVSLVSSTIGSGSHFRLEFQNPAFASPLDSMPQPDLYLEHLPRKFIEVRSGGSRSNFVRHVTEYLDGNGFQRCDLIDAGLIVMDATTEEFISDLRAVNPTAAIIECRPVARFKHTGNESSLIPVIGPLHTEQLDGILQNADQLFKRLSEEAAKRQSEYIASTNTPITPPPEGIQSPDIINLGDLCLQDTQSTAPSSGTLVHRTIKALLVDDNIINLRVLEMFCRKRSIIYVTAQDGNQASELYEAAAEAGEPFTLVLMDLQMPHCDGIQATANIRSFEISKGIESSALFMVTGQDSQEDKDGCRSAGANEFMVKPVRPKDVDKHIARYFKNYAPRQ